MDPRWKALRSDALILTELATFYLFASRKKTFPMGSSTASLSRDAGGAECIKAASKRILRLVKRLMYGCLIIAMLAISNSKTAAHHEALGRMPSGDSDEFSGALACAGVILAIRIQSSSFSRYHCRQLVQKSVSRTLQVGVASRAGSS